MCRDNDKNKWLDRAVVLRWDEAQLRKLTKYRLSNASEICGEPVDPEAAWQRAFSVTHTRWGHEKRRGEDTFKYLVSRTFSRPRDLISYVRECARIAESKGLDRIDNVAIKEGLLAHSAYMRREVIDELFPVLDEISEILDVISRMKKIIFTKKEFSDRYREMQKSITIPERNRLSEAQIMKLLFHFNVVGNVGVGGHRVFAYESDVKVLDVERPMCVHNGLLKALKIV